MLINSDEYDRVNGDKEQDSEMLKAMNDWAGL